MNYYERHLGDYTKDTAHLSMVEHGAYTLLLDRYYATEAGIPADQAHRVARARSKEEKAAVDAVLAEFFDLVDGVWTNGRAEEEIASARVRMDASRTNGKKGGRPKKATQQKPTGLSAGSQNETQQKAHQSPVSNHQSPEEESNRHTEDHEPPRDDDMAPPDWLRWSDWFAAEVGVEHDVNALHDRRKFRPLAEGWITAGVTCGQMRRAIAKARAEAKEPIAYMPGYADRVLATLTTPQTHRPLSAHDQRVANVRGLSGADRNDQHAASTGDIVDIDARCVG